MKLRRMLLLVPLCVVTGCTTPMMLPSSGVWENNIVLLGPVVVCKGGNFTTEPEGCNQWPLSIPSLPSPEIHYAELRAKAAEQYQVDIATVILKDVVVEYNAELNGVIRGWKASAIAGIKEASALTPVKGIVLAAEKQVVFTQSANGTRNTRPFTVADRWELQWDVKGSKLTVFLFTADGDPRGLLPIVTQDKPGASSSYYPKAGSYYLKIFTDGDWTITVVQLP